MFMKVHDTMKNNKHFNQEKNFTGVNIHWMGPYTSCLLDARLIFKKFPYIFERIFNSI